MTAVGVFFPKMIFQSSVDGADVGFGEHAVGDAGSVLMMKRWRNRGRGREETASAARLRIRTTSSGSPML